MANYKTGAQRYNDRMHKIFAQAKVNNVRYAASYEKELQQLKPWDEVQYTNDKLIDGLPFITTAGHGYLVVPASHPRFEEAKDICKYGFIGQLAVYLEEDCEMPAYIEGK